MDALKKPRLLILQPVIWQRMLEDVRARTPLEACGLLAGKGNRIEKVYPTANVLASAVRFQMAPEEQLKAFLDIEARQLELLAIYHSHPGGPPQPSPTDLVEFAYPGVLYLIWFPGETGWEARCFEITGERFLSARLEVQAGE